MAKTTQTTDGRGRRASIPTATLEEAKRIASSEPSAVTKESIAAALKKLETLAPARPADEVALDELMPALIAAKNREDKKQRLTIQQLYAEVVIPAGLRMSLSTFKRAVDKVEHPEKYVEKVVASGKGKKSGEGNGSQTAATPRRKRTPPTEPTLAATTT